MQGSIFTPDLRLEPWWWEEAAPAPCEHARLPARVDVAIVGAGFTGLSAALTLARAGRSVLVLDATAAGQGASTRNGGMIGSGHRLSYEVLSQRHGRDRALAILAEGLTALEYTTDLIARERIDCRFERTGRFRAACRPADYEAMARELELLRRELRPEADMVARTEQHREIGTDAYYGGCVYHRHGGLHPALFHRGLLERARAAGAEIIGGAPVTRIERDGQGFRLTARDQPVVANAVIVASNGYTGSATPALRRRIVPVASYIIATERLTSEMLARLIPGKRMIVETGPRHAYYRIAPDGRRLLFGGRAALASIDPRKSAVRLHRFMHALFPELASVEVTHSWAGLVAFSRDGLPHLGVRDGVHYALAYCGSGVAMAPYLGYKIAQRLLRSKAAATAFDDLAFPAIPLYTGRPWFLPLLDLYHRWRVA